MKTLIISDSDENLIIRALANYQKKQRQREKNAAKYEKPDLVLLAQIANARADVLIQRIEKQAETQVETHERCCK